ncbi:MAG: hypothetical protein H0T43_05925 [Solirubrobacterales bacterium]|nr:hypothetical protein [Solirubrobacterales bacterium]
MRGRHGRVEAITIITPVRGWWSWWLRLSWPFARGNPLVLRPLLRLAFIHFAHWSLIRRGRGRYLLFQSNFNGDVKQYVDAFSLTVPGRMRLMWGGAHGFPGPRPMERFKRFIFGRAIPADHYWSAYPEATTRMVTDALDIRARYGEVDAIEAGPEAFAAAYRRFIIAVQNKL